MVQETVALANPISRCLVIGASGFIGRNLVGHLARHGIAVRALSRSGEALVEHPLIEWVKGDMLDEASLQAALEGVDACLQLATTTKPASSNANIVHDITSNLIANVRLLEMLVARGGIRFVFLSSGGTVYGDAKMVPIPEAHSTEPKSSYGICKLTIEKYIVMFSRLHGLEAQILRVSNPFGEYQPHSDGQGVIASFLWRALNNQPVDIIGDGSVVRDYLYIGDVCDAIMATLNYHGTKQLFNIGQGRGQSVLEIVQEIEECLGSSVEMRFLPGRATDVRVSLLDCTLAHRELGWHPATSFSAGLERTAAWMRTQMS